MTPDLSSPATNTLARRAAGAALLTSAGIVRRYCDCGVRQSCRCGLPLASSGWSVAGLTDLRDLMREHGSLKTVARLSGRSVRECNRALNALLGRTPVHALAALEGHDPDRVIRFDDDIEEAA